MSTKKDNIASHEEVLKLLTKQARSGSIHATVALGRELRAADKMRPDVDEVIDRILKGEGTD
jgi:hypothetical protein